MEPQREYLTSNSRKQYLLQTLRLNHDPFAYATTELELQVDDKVAAAAKDEENGNLSPSFLAYFVHPPYISETAETDKPILEQLKQPGHSFVYTANGGGKTMLRYVLEAACRFVPEQTLVLSYPLGKETTDSSAFTIEETLNQTLAVDLFVQTLEQYAQHQAKLDDDLLANLITYWRNTIPGFSRKLRRHLALGRPHSGTEMAVWWWVWQRLAVRYRPLTPSWEKFARSILAWPSLTESSETTTLQDGLALAYQLGYKRVYVLLDVAGNADQKQKELSSQIITLFKLLSNTPSPIPLYLKAFLPEQLALINREQNPPLTPTPFSAIIKWNNPEALLQIIENRFRSAGSWIEGFDAISSQTIAAQINQLLVWSAHGSPRRLLQIVNALIDAHVQGSQAAETNSITEADWLVAQQRLVCNSSSKNHLPQAARSRGDVINDRRNEYTFALPESTLC